MMDFTDPLDVFRAAVHALNTEDWVLARQLWVSGHPDVALFRRQPDGTWRLTVEHDFLNMSSLSITGVRMEGEPGDGEEQSTAE